MASVASKINRDYKGNVDEKSTTINVAEIGLAGSGELFHHIAKLVCVKNDPRVKSLVTRYNGWYVTGDCPPKFITEIKDLVNSELWANPIEYGDDATIDSFSRNMLSQINYRWKDAPKLMKKDSNYKWVVNKEFTGPYMNLPLFCKYVKGFILWNEVKPILLNPKIEEPHVNTSSSSTKSAYDTLFPDDSDCTKSGADGNVDNSLLYKVGYKFSSGINSFINGLTDGVNGKKR